MRRVRVGAVSVARLRVSAGVGPWAGVFMQAFLNGEYMDLADAKVNVMTHALNYGTGVFEGIRAYWDDEEEQLLLFRVREHFERMHQSGPGFCASALTIRSMSWLRSA